MLNFFRRLIPDHHPLRLFYHRVVVFLGAVIYRFPSRHLKIIAVTGTCGKTTTCHFIAEILREAGYKVGLATTIGFRIGERDIANDTKMTTVGRFAIQRLLRQMVRAGCDYAVLEVTSHALIQSRIAGVSIDTALLTNVTGDHIEYHGGFQNYLDAKAKLFRLLSSSSRKPRISKKMILNRDDEHFYFFDRIGGESAGDSSLSKIEKYTYGISHSATAMARDIIYNEISSRFVLEILNESMEIYLNLPGVFNVYNALAAATVAATEHVPLSKIASALAKLRMLPGRFEHIEMGQPFTVSVDYAHTPQSLEGLLRVYREMADRQHGRLFVVFGATGGGRDKGKRPHMGRVAHEIADYVIVTSDDPYEEDEHEIIRMVCEGIPRREGEQERFWKIPDRRSAIFHALSLARTGDSVVIAGKGCEPVQMIYGKRIAWDDREVVREILKKHVTVNM